jgi:HPt (histidine-containing phosphotransfer) domain-containing protein
LMTAQITDDHVDAQRCGLAYLLVQKPINLAGLRKILGQHAKRDNSGPLLVIDEAALVYLKTYFEQIQHAFSARSWDELATQAHKLGGAALMSGLEALGGVALDLERVAKTKDEARSAVLISDIKEQLISLADHLVATS